MYTLVHTSTHSYSSVCVCESSLAAMIHLCCEVQPMGDRRSTTVVLQCFWSRHQFNQQLVGQRVACLLTSCENCWLWFVPRKGAAQVEFLRRRALMRKKHRVAPRFSCRVTLHFSLEWIQNFNNQSYKKERKEVDTEEEVLMQQEYKAHCRISAGIS